MKYLLNGTAVEVIEVLKSGFLVKQIYESEDDQFLNGGQFVVPNVFDKAPTQVLDKEVAELRERIKALGSSVSDLETLKEEHLASIKAMDSKLKRNQKLSRLMDFIEGKIEFYVEDNGYGSIKIIPFKEAICEADEYRKRDLKLLSLFGKSNGDLTYGLNRYNDGSGQHSNVYPATSHNEAIQIVKDLIETRMQSQTEDPERLVKAADEHGIHIPMEYRLKAIDKSIHNLQKGSERNLKEKQELDHAIACLESKKKHFQETAS